MFNRILLPTDGSPLSQEAADSSLQFAKQINAQVVGVYVAPPFHVLTMDPNMVEDTQEEYAEEVKKKSEEYLAVIRKHAEDLAVPCEVSYVVDDNPAQRIVAYAQEKGCDLIAMGTHGRTGIRRILLGSVTNKVLSNTTIPVLVFH